MIDFDTFEEFKLAAGAKIEPGSDLDAFAFFCFCEIFKSDPPHPTDEVLALLAAHQFSKSNPVESFRFSQKALCVRHPRLPFSARAGPARKMKM